MAIIKVRLKDAGQNTLHPETDWSVVENRPAITVGTSNGQKRETWSAPTTSVVGVNTLYLASHQGNITINDRTAGKDTLLADYPIKWSAISGKPSYLVDKERMVFGYYDDEDSNPEGLVYTGTVYPAMRKYKYNDNHGQGMTYTYTSYYFNGTSWVTLDNSKFTPGL